MSKLDDIAKKIPTYLAAGAICATVSFKQFRKTIIDLQDAESKAEARRRLADAMGITVEELGILNNPLLNKKSDDPRQSKPERPEQKPL